MVTNTHSKWAMRWGTLVLWAAAGASVVYWGLRLSSRPSGLPAAVAVPAPAAPDAGALARLLGASPAAAVAKAPVAAPSSRFALQGVLSGRSSGGGAALIAMDGKPARPYRVGAQVDAGLVLQSLGPRQASLGASVDGPTTVRLEMPPKG
jgi:general secretion pathway protein C